MATFPTRSKSTIVSNIAAGMQGRLAAFLNFATGGVFLAIAEAYAGVALWIQGMILQVAMLTRLSTSYNSDVDSWIADFGIITRIGSVAATGLVVFSRFSAASSSPLIPIGATVKTLDGTQSFQVYADTSNTAYNAVAGGYVMPAQITSLVVPVVSITPSPNGAVLPSGAISPGANGNVAAGAIALISSQIVGVDSVTNPNAFTNGSDQETDAALKIRFRAAIQALSRATPAAIAFVIQSLQTNLQVEVASNTAPDGVTVMNGMTTVYVDDGSGAISSALLTQCQTAAFSYLAAGTRMGVYAASASMVSIALSIVLKPGYSRANIAPLVSAAISAAINGGGLGAEVDYFTIGSVALAVPGVAKIEGLTLNGATSDLPSSIAITYKSRGVLVN